MVAEAATTGAAQAAPATSLRRVREVDMVYPLFRWGDVFVARMREPVGLRPDTEEKHTLNLSFNINPWLAHGLGAIGGLTPLPSFAPAGEPATPGRSASPCFAAKSARAGTLMSLSEGAALGHNFSSPVRRSQQKMEEATAPSPSSSLCRYRAPKFCPYESKAE